MFVKLRDLLAECLLSSMYRSGRSKSPDQKRQSNRASEPSTSSEDERSRRSGRDYNATELKRAYERATCSQG